MAIDAIPVATRSSIDMRGSLQLSRMPDGGFARGTVMKAAAVHRRRPKQARSQSTVDAIYEATLQLIEREGAERITTHRISEVSGFSIGTLYQYFHDRDSLLMAMAIAHRDRLIERLKTTLAASRDQHSREAISRLVAVIVADARSNRKMLRAVARAVARKEMATRMLDAMRVLDQYIGRSLAELAGKMARCCLQSAGSCCRGR